MHLKAGIMKLLIRFPVLALNSLGLTLGGRGTG